MARDGTPSLPPSPRRLAAARRAGRVPWSPVLVGGAAIAGASAAAIATGEAVIAAIRDLASRDLAAAAAATDPVAVVTSWSAAPLLAAVAALAAPIAITAGLAALAAHMTQVRSLIVPRRRGVDGLPPAAAGVGRRVGDVARATGRATAVAAVATGIVAGHAGALVWSVGGAPAATTALALGVVGAVLIWSAVALLALGVVDWLERAWRHHADLRMTPRERRADDRATQGDPRWRRERRRRLGEAARADRAVSGASIIIIGAAADGGSLAVAIRWHPRWQPTPRIVAVERGLAATRLIALARRHAVPAHAEPGLAGQLAAVAVGVDVPAALHDPLARVIAALRPAVA